MGIGGRQNKMTHEERLYKLVKQYTVSDIKAILEAEIDAAGTVLMPALSGMIALGKLLYGFHLTDREALTKFGRYRMKIPKIFCEILYDNVRSGLISQWASQSRIVLVMNDVKSALFRASPTRIVINAARLSHEYVEAVERLSLLDKIDLKKDEPGDQEWCDLRNQVESAAASLIRW